MAYSADLSNNLWVINSAWCSRVTQNLIGLIFSYHITMGIIGTQLKLLSGLRICRINYAIDAKSQPRLIHIIIELNYVRLYELAIVLVILKTNPQITLQTIKVYRLRHGYPQGAAG